jgi:hypothetical protein
LSVAGPFGAGAHIAAPSPRFHFPLVEPNVRYLRTRCVTQFLGTTGVRRAGEPLRRAVGNYAMS